MSKISFLATLAFISISGGTTHAFHNNLSVLVNNRDVHVGTKEIRVTNNSNLYNLNLKGADQSVEFAKEKGKYRLEAQFDKDGKVNRVSELLNEDDDVTAQEFKLSTAHLNQGKELQSFTTCDAKFYLSTQRFSNAMTKSCLTVTPESCKRILDRAALFKTSRGSLDACLQLNNIGEAINGYDDEHLKKDANLKKMQETNIDALKKITRNAIPGAKTIELETGKEVSHTQGIKSSLYFIEVYGYLKACEQIKGFISSAKSDAQNTSKSGQAESSSSAR